MRGATVSTSQSRRGSLVSVPLLKEGCQQLGFSISQALCEVFFIASLLNLQHRAAAGVVESTAYYAAAEARV